MIKVKDIKTCRGGKSGNGTYQNIINEIPPHNTLIVPFLGNCGVTRHIAQAITTICIDKDPKIIKKWQRSHVSFVFYETDAIRWLENLYMGEYKSSQTVIYCDPPYPRQSRKTKEKLFKHEMSDSDHKRLLDALKKQTCKVLISTYDNDLYKLELQNWRVKKYVSTTRRGGAIESLYMNYEKPEELHDYSFLGDNYRERERIKRKIKRTVRKFRTLPPLERNAIFNQLRRT